jgi:Sulfotransferase family
MMLGVWYLASLAIGVGLGALAAIVFRLVVPAGTTGKYWNDVGGAVRGLLHGAEEQFWKSYFGLIRRSLGYVGRQLVALAAATLPLILAFHFAAPVMSASWDAGGRLEVHPEAAGRVIDGGQRSASSGSRTRLLSLSGGREVTLPGKPGSIAVCANTSRPCKALYGIGFTVVPVDPEMLPVSRPIIIRTAHDDWNPFWPYLNDPEFLLFLGMSLPWLLVPLLRRRTDPDSDRPLQISGIDFALSQIATAGAGVVKRIGDLEANWNRPRLRASTIDRPVFIAGLARSGTTILLEKLSRIDGVATHRYRDFPFVMAPIYWSRFVALFGTGQNPKERPHHDSIFITRESPEAFEEPIWQHFFSRLHDPGSSQVLTAADRNAAFDEFFRLHIQKILLLRRGNRYVSKGNYNLTRIPYLASLFPDAFFLVPIRHPLTHVESLTRQHKLFCSYAALDERVGPYLRAVGHYEFGPDRSPIFVDPIGTARTLDFWRSSNDAAGYAQQWSDLYGLVLGLRRSDNGLRQRVRVVRFEDLTADPVRELGDIVEFAGLCARRAADSLAAGIAAPVRLDAIESGSTNCWQIVESVASAYGYTMDPRELRRCDWTIS